MTETRLILGDCLDELKALPDASVDAICTDPPYGINFMGKAWDGAAIAEAAETKRRETTQHLRLTGSPDSPNRTLIPRSGSAFQNRAGEAGAYDFSARGNRAFQQWCETWGAECLRVLKPGGHMLVFGGTRTYHRLACGLEDAGFEIRDEILAWMFGSGFPKSHDVSKAIDRAAGAERQVIGPDPEAARRNKDTPRFNGNDYAGGEEWQGAPDVPLTAPATPEAEAWSGFGTALKPAHEPIVVARKPLMGTVAANVLANGTGALNIGGCRIGYESADDQATAKPGGRATAKVGALAGGTQNDARRTDFIADNTKGRWPANVVLVHAEDCVQLGTMTLRGDQRETGNGTRPGGFADIGAPPGDCEPNAPVYGNEQAEVWECVEGCPVRTLDEQTGVSRSSGGSGSASRGRLGDLVYGEFAKYDTGESLGNHGGLGDVGGASRFFYCAKVSRAERNAGLEGFDAKMLRWSSGDQSPGTFQGEGTDKTARNHHPTVKPIALMRWLIRLVAPPGGTVLDPFLGSGSAGCAAALEGFRFIGIEREADYMKIAAARIAFWAEHGEDGLRICAERDGLVAKRAAVEAAGQLSFLDG